MMAGSLYHWGILRNGRLILKYNDIFYRNCVHASFTKFYGCSCNHENKFVQIKKLQFHNATAQTKLRADNAELDELENKYETVYNKILFNSYLAKLKGCQDKRYDRKLQKKRLKEDKINDRNPADNIPLALKYLGKPYKVEEIKGTNYETDSCPEDSVVRLPYSVETELNNDFKPQETSNWMSDYECYDERDDSTMPWELNYGTPNRAVPVSKVPCGGCGALLHCQDTSIPGYLPSQLFEFQDDATLRSMLCQRCHFFRNYDTALNVIVSPDDYVKVMGHVKHQFALIILMVDLLDFPCSLWPGITEIIGPKQPIVVVGNKVDLLPPDSKPYLHRIRKTLVSYLEDSGISSSNIKHVSLISAKTGYGIEELISHLHRLWEYRGDVFVLGCTNVGKSTLFNALLQSDYCKVKAVDLVQRATTSPWPGTTIKLLKFPILRPSGMRLAQRLVRMKTQEKEKQSLIKLHVSRLKDNKDQEPALIGHIGMTFYSKPVDGSTDPFSFDRDRRPKPLSGLDPDDKHLANSKWCYDTPGVVHPHQVIHLLTTEELMMTLCKKLILPNTFRMTPNMSLFVAGLGRLDYVEGDMAVRMTVFASNDLPVTICRTQDANEMYQTLLGSKLLGVPSGGPARLSQWPALQSHPDVLELQGIGRKESCADVVLSSAGWVAITAHENRTCKFVAWTPGGRGVYVRRPALLPFSVRYCGHRIPFSPQYKRGSAIFWQPW